MKPISALHLTALVVVLHIGPSYGNEKESETQAEKTQALKEMFSSNVQTDYKENYYGGNNYADVDYLDYYSDTDVSDVPSNPPISCYTCFYQHSSTPQGEKNCDDPFRPDLLPQIICSHPCGKVYQQTDLKGSYTMTRHCMKDCRDYSREDGYSQCCTSDLCNSATPTTSHWTTTVTCALLTVAVARLLR